MLVTMSLLPGDPARSNRVAKYLDNAVLKADHREHRTFTGDYKGVRISVCSTGMGCPSTAIAVEELANIGAHTFIRIGSSAALQPDIRIGDIVISNGAMKNEGTSKFYVPECFPAVPDLEFTYLLTQVAKEMTQDSDLGVYNGISATDDAFLRRNRSVGSKAHQPRHSKYRNGGVCPVHHLAFTGFACRLHLRRVRQSQYR